MPERLPHYRNARIDAEKLRAYVLNANHPQGKHKARVFKSMLGLESLHSDAFATVLVETLPRAMAVKGLADEFGERWSSYHEVIGINGKSAIISAGWIYKIDSPDVPVLVTCYIEPERQEELKNLLDLE